jgi:hypothetical protein
MTGPLAGADGDLGASTINVKDIDGGPLGSATRDLGLSTINANNFDGGPPGRWCQRSGSAHYQH